MPQQPLFDTVTHWMRHALSLHNLDGKQRGKESPLAEEAPRQIELAAVYAASLGITHIVTSTATSALGTAYPLAEKLGIPATAVIESDLFCECRPASALLGKNSRIDWGVRELAEKINNAPHLQHADEERDEELEERLRQAFAFLRTLPSTKIRGNLAPTQSLVLTHYKFSIAAFRYIQDDERLLPGSRVRGGKRTGFPNTGVMSFTYGAGHHTTERLWRLYFGPLGQRK